MSEATQLAVAEKPKRDTGNYQLKCGMDTKTLGQLANFIDEQHEAIATATNETARSIIKAGLYATLEEAIDGQLLDTLLTLEGKRHGFKTDRKYTRDELKSILVSAFVNNIRITDNELNVIAGGPYATKEFFRRCIEEHPLISNFESNVASDFDVSLSGQRSQGGYKKGVVKTSGYATWLINGVRQEFRADLSKERGDMRLVRKYQESDAPDQLIGKFESALWRRVWNKISGMNVPDTASFDPETGEEFTGETLEAEVVRRDEQPESSEAISSDAEPTPTPDDPGDASQEQATPEDPHAAAFNALAERSENWLIKKLESIKKLVPELWHEEADKALETVQGVITKEAGDLPSDFVAAIKESAEDQVKLWKKANRGDRANGDA